MNFHKYFQYVFLVIACLFIEDAVSKYLANQTYWTSILLAASAIFMFFFKKSFAKKFENQNKK